MTSTTLTPSAMEARPEYIAKLLMKLTAFVPAYSLDMKKPEILKAWVEDLSTYRLKVGDFDEAFRKVRDGYKTFPSIAEFKQILGVTMTDESTVESVTAQIWAYLAHGAPLSIFATDTMTMLGGHEAFSDIDVRTENGRHAVRAQVRSVVASLGSVTPEKLRVAKRTENTPPAKARTELIAAQTSEINRDVGPINYRQNGELDHDEFHQRVASQRPGWMPDDWWIEVRSQIIEKSIPEWQNGLATGSMIRELRAHMKRTFAQCMA